MLYLVIHNDWNEENAKRSLNPDTLHLFFKYLYCLHTQLHMYAIITCFKIHLVAVKWLTMQLVVYRIEYKSLHDTTSRMLATLLVHKYYLCNLIISIDSQNDGSRVSDVVVNIMSYTLSALLLCMVFVSVYEVRERSLYKSELVCTTVLLITFYITSMLHILCSPTLGPTHLVPPLLGLKM